MKTLCATALLVFLSHLAFAATTACPDNFEVFDNTQIQTLESNGICLYSIHPRNVDHLLYRDFLIDSEGLLMIFDSYGEGSESETTAARNYHFFPRTKPLSYSYDSATKRLNVVSPSGKILSFDTMKAIMTGISGAQVSFNYEVSPAHHGGVEIVSNDSLYMDGGFKRGQSPSQNPKDPIHFKDSAGAVCTLANGDVYRYTADQDSVFKFNDGQLKSFLGSRCPQLRF